MKERFGNLNGHEKFEVHNGFCLATDLAPGYETITLMSGQEFVPLMVGREYKTADGGTIRRLNNGSAADEIIFEYTPNA